MNQSVAFFVGMLGIVLLLACHKKPGFGPKIQQWETTVLLNPDGKESPLQDIRPPLKLVYFGYTRCAESCPVALASMVGASALLGRRARNLALVFISIDPAYDTPARIKAYVQSFRGRRILAFTADGKTHEALQKLMAAFGILAHKKGGSIQHTPFLYLLSKDNRLIRTYSAGLSARGLRTELEKMPDLRSPKG